MEHRNHVELAGTVVEVRGGQTRNDGYWLRVTLAIDLGDEHPTRQSFWWFGGREDRDVYLDVQEGAEVHAIGELRWGRNHNDDWELRVIALVINIETGERPGTGRNGNGRNDRNVTKDRKGSSERSERRERNKPRPIKDDEEAPF